MDFKDVQITRGTTDFIKAGLSVDEEYYLPAAQHPWHLQQTQSYCIKVELPEGKRIIIPCMEMIRFYFGSSASFLHRLFMSNITYEHLWKSKHFDPVFERLHLKLSDGISGASAADIGRIAMNQEARCAASLIFRTCQLALLNSQPIYPYTGFPFTGKTNLTASGIWLSRGAAENSTFVVYRLKSCAHPFPFQSLAYESTYVKKAGSNKNQKNNQSQTGEEQSPVGQSVRGGKQTLSEDDPGKSKSSREHPIKTNARFPDLVSKAVWRERYDTVDAPVTLLMFTSEDEKVSVGESHGNSSVRSVDIVCQTSTELSTYIGKLPKFVRDGIKMAAQKANLSDRDAAVELITPLGCSHPVISLPYLVDEHGEIDPVSFCLDAYGESRSRRGCFVEIKEGKITRCRVLIVEGEDTAGETRVIDVGEFDLRRAMKKLVEMEVNKVNGGDDVAGTVIESVG